MIKVYVDGLAEPKNPGIAAYGYVIYRDNVKIDEGYGGIGEQTNNYAEYYALMKALERLVELGLTNQKIVVKSDSQLLVNQLNGRYRVRSSNILPIYNRVMLLLSKFKDIRIDWIPRSDNYEADKLSRKGYLTLLKERPELLEKYRRYMATPRQKKILMELGLEVDEYISKRAASRAIAKYLKRRRRKI